LTVAAKSEFTVSTEVRGYLGGLLDTIRKPLTTAPWARGERHLASAVFDILTSREFSYLSRSQSEPYRFSAEAILAKQIARAERLRFFLDLGAGYHATLRPGVEPLSFDVGLGELLVLRQIAAFRQRVAEVYSEGVSFVLVIDNMAALLVNDIPLEATTSYCREYFAMEDFERQRAALDYAAPRAVALTDRVYENVVRFLGRPCSPEEALERALRYEPIIEVSESLLEELIDGVHLTQRATASTLAFRPFPGGATRIQCGEVALCHNEHGKLRPFLLTSHNVDAFDLEVVSTHSVLPAPISWVRYGRRRP
jgi:hypothetical protein